MTGAKPEAKLSEFISIFMGFAMTKTVLEVLHEVNELITKMDKKAVHLAIDAPQGRAAGILILRALHS